MTIGPETCYRVRGGASLHGTVFVQGAKNAALKMIAASLLASEGRTVLRNVPPIEDVRRAIELAHAVGAVVKFHEAERTLVVDASRLTSPVLPAEIARRFSDPGFNLDAVVRTTGLSRRYIQQLLEETGQSFTDHVLERRLERAFTLLSDRRRLHLSVLDVAYAAGFGDVSHFNRMFRRRFGDTPSGVRAAAHRVE